MLEYDEPTRREAKPTVRRRNPKFSFEGKKKKTVHKNFQPKTPPTQGENGCLSPITIMRFDRFAVHALAFVALSHMPLSFNGK